MPRKFIGRKELAFVAKINRELIQEVIGQEVTYYQVLADKTKTNDLYNEAVRLNRQIMGATNPKDAAPGTIRKDFALSIQENTVHGSDSPETALWEVAYFFPGLP